MACSLPERSVRWIVVARYDLITEVRCVGTDIVKFEIEVRVYCVAVCHAVMFLDCYLCRLFALRHMLACASPNGADFMTV